MAAVALLMRDAGHQVSGSDEDVFPPMSTYVEGLGFPFYRRFDGENLPQDLDVLVLGASAKLGGESNREVIAARARGVPVTTFAEMLGEVTSQRQVTVVAGSFGKSTCTALMAHILVEAGADPGWMVGAISPSLEATGHWGSGPVVIEGDEYILSDTDRRSKFQLYRPSGVLLTSLIHDHVNVFPTFPEYEAPFRDLLAKLPASGLAVMREHPAIRAIAGETSARVVWYDTAPGPGWHCRDVVFSETTRFDLVAPDGRVIPLTTGLLGAHNVENIVGVAAYLLELGLVSEESLTRGVASFAGIRRRLDRLTKSSRIPVIEGFGSSYEKAHSAIEAMQLHYPERPLVVVFEPHTFSWRSRDALPWYDTVFEGASRVLICPPPVHGAASHHQSTYEEIVERTEAAGFAVEKVTTAEEAMAALSGLKGDEAVLLLSSGPLLGLPDALPAMFDRLYSEPAFA
ncbi:UDP-N-acetylmuramate: L-alanyl-gamma-D-glutamyl-meso-diaminopimelate ligase [Phenylobacterium koreense]|uniref:UDP-N-acetylmuramate: L-alanyl-gamma-D-glutamyl-meso-diaminopimelate ligase n=2 Tax=Caulobacteraceae TaxID=76892 RepID=A0ABV2EDE7_9CAUL